MPENLSDNELDELYGRLRTLIELRDLKDVDEKSILDKLRQSPERKKIRNVTTGLKQLARKIADPAKKLQDENVRVNQLERTSPDFEDITEGIENNLENLPPWDSLNKDIEDISKDLEIKKEQREDFDNQANKLKRVKSMKGLNREISNADTDVVEALQETIKSKRLSFGKLIRAQDFINSIRESSSIGEVDNLLDRAEDTFDESNKQQRRSLETIKLTAQFKKESLS